MVGICKYGLVPVYSYINAALSFGYIELDKSVSLPICQLASEISVSASSSVGAASENERLSVYSPKRASGKISDGSSAYADGMQEETTAAAASTDTIFLNFIFINHPFCFNVYKFPIFYWKSYPKMKFLLSMPLYHNEKQVVFFDSVL